MIEQFLATVSPVGRVAYILFLLENELNCLTADTAVPPSDDYSSAVDDLQLAIDTMRETIVHSPINMLSDAYMKQKVFAVAVTKMTQKWQGLMDSPSCINHRTLIAAITTTLLGFAMLLTDHADANATIQGSIIKYVAKLSDVRRKAVLESVAQAAKALMPYAKQDYMLPKDVFGAVPHWPMG